MRLICLCFVILLAIVAPVSAVAGAGNVAGIALIKLPDTEGTEVALSCLNKAKATVFVLLAPECPISQQCTRELNALAAIYAARGISFFGVFPGNYYSVKEVAAFKTTYHVGFPFLIDEHYALTDVLKGRITPEVFVVGPDETVLYSGAIDNAYKELGRKSVHTTAHYLADALVAVADNKTVAVQHVNAIGCLIYNKTSVLHE